jgi:hypothetical protein
MQELKKVYICIVALRRKCLKQASFVELQKESIER